MFWKIFKGKLLVFLCLILPIVSSAQFYSAGQDPGSVKWLQIRTQNFQVIFPGEYEEQASYIADLLEYAYEHVSHSLDHHPRRVSVIIHNQTVVSNGFVSWAPRRMELFTNPPSDNEVHDWLDHLVVHEFRHVVQVDKLNQGITRLLGIVFGEQATGAILGLNIPLWFLEGDAVVTETAFSRGGRGRLPAFEQGLRTQVLERGRYSYDKAMFGSYKDYVPNHYELGYQLVAAARAEHGSEVWSGVIDNVARRPWQLFPFSRGMKKETGRHRDKHYKHTFTILDSAWTYQKESHHYTEAAILTRENRLYTNYQQAYWTSESTIIALKTGLKDIPRLVKIHMDGEEKELFAPGWYFPQAFHYAAGKIVWNELHPDPRWEHRSWSEIMVYDLEKDSRKKLISRARLFAPALSPDGKRIAAVETSSLNRYALVVLDAETGHELWRFSYLGNDLLQTPAWHPAGELIAVVALNDQGKRIDILDTGSGFYYNALPASHTEISAPRFLGDDILFTGSWSGIDNIYLLDTQTGNAKMVVSSMFGAVNAAPDPAGKTVAYSDYTSGGYRLKTLAVQNFDSIPLARVEDHSVGFHKILSDQENTLITRKHIPRNEHDVMEYNKTKNLFHLHSWAPLNIDANNQDVNFGASMMFQNKLSTSFTTLGYLWDTNEETGRFSVNYSYQGWYPVLDITGETGMRRYYYLRGQSLQNFLWTENNLKVGLSVPLQFRRHEYFYGFVPSFRLGMNQAARNDQTPDRIFVDDNRYFVFNENRAYQQEYRLLGYRQIRSVSRDVYPRWGQIVDVNYRHTPFGNTDMGSIFAARGVMYFPGFVRHHGFRLSLAYQQKISGERKANTINYTFGNLVLYPRGITGQTHEQLKVVSGDYAFPILYPDLSLRPVLYLMRLRGSLFADYAAARLFPDAEKPELDLNQQLYSCGFTLVGDMHLLRFLAPVSLGVQVAFPDNLDTKVQLLVGVRF